MQEINIIINNISEENKKKTNPLIRVLTKKEIIEMEEYSIAFELNSTELNSRELNSHFFYKPISKIIDMKNNLS